MVSSASPFCSFSPPLLLALPRKRSKTFAEIVEGTWALLAALAVADPFLLFLDLRSFDPGFLPEGMSSNVRGVYPPTILRRIHSFRKPMRVLVYQNGSKTCAMGSKRGLIGYLLLARRDTLIALTSTEQLPEWAFFRCQ